MDSKQIEKLHDSIMNNIEGILESYGVRLWSNDDVQKAHLDMSQVIYESLEKILGEE